MMSGYWDAMIKRRHSKQAVSEVVGVVLLLGITLTLFAVLNFYVFHFSFDPSVTSVNLIGTIDKANNMIDIEHTGGESLDENTQIIITIGSNTYNFTVSSHPEEIQDDKWNFGETVRFHSPESITNKYIQVQVVDPVKNSILLSVVLQQT
jgi:hypothetical protein